MNRIRTPARCFGEPRDSAEMTAEDQAIVHDLRHVGFMAWLREASGGQVLRNREAEIMRDWNAGQMFQTPAERARANAEVAF